MGSTGPWAAGPPRCRADASRAGALRGVDEAAIACHPEPIRLALRARSGQASRGIWALVGTESLRPIRQVPPLRCAQGRNDSAGTALAALCSMKRYIELFKNTWTEFSNDKAQRLGAALAYYTLFSIAPLLLIAIAIAGLVFVRSQAQAQIVAQLRTLMGDAGAKAIEEMLVNAAKPKSGTLAIVIGIVILLFGAAGVFGQLKDALNTIWNVPEKKSGGITAMLKERLLSFAMVLGTGFLLLVSLVIDAALAALDKALWQPV